MVPADTLERKQGIKTVEHRSDPSCTYSPKTDASENLFDFLVGNENEPAWHIEPKLDLDVEALQDSDDRTVKLLRVHVFDVQILL